jgi:hypothetical protein
MEKIISRRFRHPRYPQENSEIARQGRVPALFKSRPPRAGPGNSAPDAPADQAALAVLG